MGNTVHRTLPADTSPPARLLATRPCCGPGPERRPVLGEAPRFHAQAKGKNVRLDGHSRRATRRNSFCNGVTFTQRPIRLYEQVRLRLVAVRPGWSGALRFGFTAHDPSLMSAQDIPKYACPDLVTRPGYWAKALPENLALRDTVLAYWADRHGRVFYSVNDGEPVLFHCGVAVGGPLWALIDVYGITDEVQLLESGFADTLTPARLGQARFSACLPPSSHDAANFDNNELENNQVVAKLGHLALGRAPGPPPADHAAAAIPCGPGERQRPASSPALLEADLRFHATRGPDVSLSLDRKVAWRRPARWPSASRRATRAGCGPPSCPPTPTRCSTARSTGWWRALGLCRAAATRLASRCGPAATCSWESTGARAAACCASTPRRRSGPSSPCAAAPPASCAYSAPCSPALRPPPHQGLSAAPRTIAILTWPSASTSPPQRLNHPW